MNIKYICTETNQRYFVRTRSDGLFDITERYTDKDDVTYMWDCIPIRPTTDTVNTQADALRNG